MPKEFNNWYLRLVAHYDPTFDINNEEMKSKEINDVREYLRSSRKSAKRSEDKMEMGKYMTEEELALHWSLLHVSKNDKEEDASYGGYDKKPRVSQFVL